MTDVDTRSESGLPEQCDLLVIGSGAAGLAASVTAAWLGLKVVVVEKTEHVGGTSAWSGGLLWIPRNRFAVAAGHREDLDAPMEYLRNQAGRNFEPAISEAFLVQGPKMVDFFHGNTSLKFADGSAFPDFHCGAPGSAKGGRAVATAPFDGRGLGDAVRLLRPPLDLLAPFGMNIASGADFRHFLNFTRNRRSFMHVAHRFLRHMRDLVVYGRGMHLVNGNALVAGLLKSALDLNVRIVTNAAAQSMRFEHGVVRGARVRIGDETRVVRASHGIVLAGGGFPHDRQRIAEVFGHAPTGLGHFSAAPRTNTGDGIRLGESVGGEVRRDLFQGGGWVPVSIVPRPNQLPGHFPHLVDRAKPGAIMVRSDGKRFCNEADSYHDVMVYLFEATPAGAPVEAWLVCDRAFIRRYGLGRVRPFPFRVSPWIRNGYLQRGQSIKALADACGIDAQTLVHTVDDYNEGARLGVDFEFGRGTTPLNRATGDVDHTPNPCVAPIEAGPFYAVKVVPGSLSTFAGLRTDQHARVLDSHRQAIPGLYAVGNDMASIAGGEYPAGGFTLGPGMTFGYIAAHHAAGISLDTTVPNAVVEPAAIKCM